jgi:hypothetical protein
LLHYFTIDCLLVKVSIYLFLCLLSGFLLIVVYNTFIA